MAMPAASVAACCSAMPTSWKRSGKRSWNGSRPVGPGMAAVMAWIRGSASAAAMSASENALRCSPSAPPSRQADRVIGSNTAGASWRFFSSSSSAGL